MPLSAGNKTALSTFLSAVATLEAGLSRTDEDQVGLLRMCKRIRREVELSKEHAKGGR